MGQEDDQKINKILITESQQENFLDFRLRWYSQDERAYLRQVYQKHYLKDKRQFMK